MTQLSQTGYDHDHDYVCVHDEPDLESVIHNDGTEWVSDDDDQPLQKTWADVMAVNLGSPRKTSTPVKDTELPQVGSGLNHKTEVPLIFVGYNRVQTDGPWISLIQIAGTVVNAMGDGEVLDAIQPMQYGWYIYIKTITDRSVLVQKGLNIAGKHILLHSEYKSSQVKSMKVTLKDLPLHSVSNEEVLEALKEVCLVQLEIRYINVWYEGYLTGI